MSRTAFVWRWIWSHACGPESKVHTGRGSRVAGHGSRVACWVGLGVKAAGPRGWANPFVMC